MKTCGDSIRVMHPLFHSGDSGSIPTSPLQMWVEPISFDFALELNGAWHSRLPKMGVGCVKRMPFPCFAATYEGKIYAVAIWSNPVARNLPQKEWLELRRLAHSPEAPKNTGSWMLSVMCQILHQTRPWLTTFISYSDMDVHKGTIYSAAGWVKTAVNKDGNWTRQSRPRPAAQSIAAKQRWEKKWR